MFQNSFLEVAKLRKLASNVVPRRESQNRILKINHFLGQLGSNYLISGGGVVITIVGVSHHITKDLTCD